MPPPWASQMMPPGSPLTGARGSEVSGGLNVIALVSGGKDSFFSLLHCIANGHRVVALANLYPPAGCGRNAASDRSLTDTTVILPRTPTDHANSLSHDLEAHPQTWETTGVGRQLRKAAQEFDIEETDLQSFMYQTVGHQVIPLYADLTNTPVYRRPISGSATQTGKEYSHAAHYLRPSDVEVQGDSSSDGQSEETESMIPLLSAVMQAHPEANAICAGAILSTYQRTRVESVAVRLGLIPLAFLWKYPVLPCPSGAHDESQLLVDLAAAGLEARIIKIASGGLDESFLWENVASPRGIARLRKAMRRFGVSETGAILGEGGEFETLVVGGPPSLFGGRIVVDPADRHVVHEGGGSAWLNLRHARVEKKATEQKQSGTVRVPDLLDTKFADILQKIASSEGERFSGYTHDQLKDLGSLGLPVFETASTLQWWCLTGVGSGSHSIEAETGSLINQIKVKLREATLRTSSILNTFILLRNMSDFSVVNQIYGSLFDEPNPPSRVSISGGDLLPQGCNIAIYLSVHIGLDWPGSERRGLHVQSRSYWAPANIGPYSQAISVPLSGLGHISGTSLPVGELVHVAGQIPLVPAKMELPPSRGEPMADFCVQAVLSLQHLWRIGAEMGVQWWMSAVAYLPRAGRELKERVPTAQRAMLVTRAWEAAHRWPPEGTSHNSDSSDGEIESNIDLWDRKYNLQSSMLAKPPAPEAKHDLPDGSVLDESYSSESRSIPAVFVAEVDELPRGAGVEWHAHAGLAHLDPSISVLVTDCSTATLRDGSVARVQHTIVRPRPDRPENAAPGAFVHSVVAIPLSASSACGGSTSSLRNLLEEIGNLVLRFTSGPSASATAQGPRCPTLLYVNKKVLALSEGDLGEAHTTGRTRGEEHKANEGAEKDDGYPLIPCVTLWSAEGENLLAVAVYQSCLGERETTLRASRCRIPPENED